MHDLTTTLAAVATAPGRGGVGCLRISGPDAFEIARGLIATNAALQLPGDGRPRFGTFLDENGQALDHGYLVAFPARRAYTGEPTVELWTHGSPPVLEALTRAALARGAVGAGPGEFTYRALRRGRIDLTRAEAVRDLIAARTTHQARIAFRQVEGSVARRLAPLRALLVDLISRGEASIEFADEAETHLAAGAMTRGLAEAEATASDLLEEARRGRIFQAGARVALSGATSVGKSSVFNRLVGKDRAIVSPVAGTTRDTLEASFDLSGLPVTLVDTAGIRHAGGAVEAEGVRRAHEAAGEADLVVVVLDAGRDLRSGERASLVDRSALGRAIVVENKIDLVRGDARRPAWPGAIPVSALTGFGFDALRQAMRQALYGAAVLEDPALTGERHVAALTEAAAAIRGALVAMPLGEEIALEDVRRALNALRELTGEFVPDDLYDRIFSTFCIGK